MRADHSGSDHRQSAAQRYLNRQQSNHGPGTIGGLCPPWRHFIQLEDQCPQVESSQRWRSQICLRRECPGAVPLRDWLDASAAAAPAHASFECPLGREIGCHIALYMAREVQQHRYRQGRGGKGKVPVAALRQIFAAYGEHASVPLEGTVAAQRCRLQIGTAHEHALTADFCVERIRTGDVVPAKVVHRNLQSNIERRRLARERALGIDSSAPASISPVDKLSELAKLGVLPGHIQMQRSLAESGCALQAPA